MSTTTDQQLTQLIAQAQAIVRVGSTVMGPSKADTIKALAELLCTPAVNQLLAATGTPTAALADADRAQVALALKAAAQKLSELRPGYTGSAVVAIDCVTFKVNDALRMVRGAA
jgi:hypothetical protein